MCFSASVAIVVQSVLAIYVQTCRRTQSYECLALVQTYSCACFGMVKLAVTHTVSFEQWPLLLMIRGMNSCHYVRSTP